MPKKIIGWSSIILGVFLMLDALLALILGKRYMLWGLEYTSDAYRVLIENVSAFPPMALLGIKLTEGAIGFSLLWIARRILYCDSHLPSQR